MRTINVSDTVRVLVTAVGDFVPGWIVRLLLEEGFTVRGVLPDLTQPPHDLSYLTELGRKHEDRFELVQLDLLEDDELLLQHVLHDCHFVVHSLVHHPRHLPPCDDGGEGLAGLAEPSAEAVRRLLSSCVGCPLLRRVVFVGSLRVCFDEPLIDGYVWSEDDRNDVSSPSRNPYSHAEAHAERCAWDYWEELGRRFPRPEPPARPGLPDGYEEVSITKQGGSMGASFAGTVLTACAAGGAAARAGLLRFIGRPVTHVDGSPIADFAEMAALVRGRDQVTLRFGPPVDPADFAAAVAAANATAEQQQQQQQQTGEEEAAADGADGHTSDPEEPPAEAAPGEEDGARSSGSAAGEEPASATAPPAAEAAPPASPPSPRSASDASPSPGGAEAGRAEQPEDSAEEAEDADDEPGKAEDEDDETGVAEEVDEETGGAGAGPAAGTGDTTAEPSECGEGAAGSAAGGGESQGAEGGAAGGELDPAALLAALESGALEEALADLAVDFGEGPRQEAAAAAAAALGRSSEWDLAAAERLLGAAARSEAPHLQVFAARIAAGPFPEPDLAEYELPDTEEPPEEGVRNILLLGPPGAGKTLFAQLLCNHLAGTGLCSPVRLSLAGVDGAPSANVALWEVRGPRAPFVLRVVDTPGLRGPGQDDGTLQGVSQALGALGELHAVCVVIPAPCGELSDIVRYSLAVVPEYFGDGAKAQTFLVMPHCCAEDVGDGVPPAAAVAEAAGQPFEAERRVAVDSAALFAGGPERGDAARAAWAASQHGAAAFLEALLSLSPLPLGGAEEDGAAAAGPGGLQGSLNPPLNPALKPRTPVRPPYAGPRPTFGVVTVIASDAVGPPVGPGCRLNAITGVVASMLNGAYRPPRCGVNVVDVRDVARAVMLSLLHDVSDGRRYLVSNQTLWLSDFAELIRSEMRRFCGNLPEGRMWTVTALARALPGLPCLLDGMTSLCSGVRAGKQPAPAPEPAATRVPLPRGLLARLGQPLFCSNDFVRRELGLPLTDLTSFLGDMVLGLVQHGFVTDTSGPPPVEEEEEYYYYFS
eukprot:TRINITY_DN19760_c0_g4_i1.p1 TRINITY_DN19760_c0_g4~~TRINITY_DN19760_c0_g4_i1.p1  ORF type:complete len:1046 (+),score=306.03 TRINITY_DN19760_c0_g4_i1:90-3227(+)